MAVSLGRCHRPVDAPVSPASSDWTSVFSGTVPRVSPEEAFGAVLFYPDDQQEIGELATQPFVADYLQDLLEQDRMLTARVAGAGRVLITGFDSAIVTCIGHDRPRAYTVVYEHPAFAQRQSQMLWNLLARAQRLDWLTHMTMRPRSEEAGEEGRLSACLRMDTVRTVRRSFCDREANAAPRWSVDHRSGGLHCGAGIGRRWVPLCGLQLQAMMPVASLSRFACIKVSYRARLEAGDHAVPGGQDLMATFVRSKDLTGWADDDCRVA